jgi:hypothetical protein
MTLIGRSDISSTFKKCKKYTWVLGNLVDTDNRRHLYVKVSAGTGRGDGTMFCR